MTSSLEEIEDNIVESLHVFKKILENLRQNSNPQESSQLITKFLQLVKGTRLSLLWQIEQIHKLPLGANFKYSSDDERIKCIKVEMDFEAMKKNSEESRDLCQSTSSDVCKNDDDMEL